MSGQLLGGIGGALVFGFLGLPPQYGFAIGSALAAEDQQIDSPTPPDPGDLSFSTSAYGKHMPWGYGTVKITPTTFWSTDFIAHHHSETTEVGGKGGGGQTATREWITYTRSFAMYLGDCTSGNEIIGIRRIWNKFTGELLYDVGDGADAATLLASTSFAELVRVYTGSTTQDPDPLMEAHEGWSPGYRGHAYVVIEDFDHGEQKQAPPLEVEVVYVGSTSYAVTPAMTDKPIYDDNFYSIAEEGIIRFWGYVFEPSQPGPVTASVPGSVYSIDGTYIEAGQASVTYINIDNPSSGNKLQVQAPIRNTSPARFCLQYIMGPSGDTYWQSGFSTSNGSTVVHARDVGGKSVGGSFATAVFHNNYIYAIPGVAQQEEARILQYGSNGGAVLNSYTDTTNVRDVYINDEGIWIVVGLSSSDSKIKKLDFSLTFVEEWTVPFATWPGICIVNDIAIIGGGTVANWFVVRLNSDGTSTTLDSGLALGSGYSMHPVVAGDMLLVRNQWISAGVLTGNGDTIANVAADLCKRGGLEASQYDPSSLPADTLRLAIARQRPGRDWLAGLAGTQAFRMRDSAGVLEFIPKGQASVATIPLADLGMSDGGQEVPPPPITTQRGMGIDLPHSVTVKYLSADADYASGSQTYTLHDYPQGRDVIINTTQVLTDQQAFDLAYIACKEPHLERLGWSTSLGIDWLHLEPGDVITLPNGDAWVKEIRQQGKNVLELALQAEASSATTSGNLPAPTQSIAPPTIKLAGPTRLEIIDAPALIDSHTGAGYLVAACGYLSGWSGCALYVSTDGGESYSRLMGINQAAGMGTAIDVLADGAPGGWDRANTVTVQMINGAPTSDTFQNIYNGANAAILGNELIKFAVAEYLGNNQYRLSILQRGRKGSEWDTGGHVAGERFVLLTAAVQRIELNTDNLNQERLLKAVSYGNSIADVEPVSFTPAGVSLKPWPPVRARAYQSGNDWILKCNERTRFGGELRNYVGITQDPEFDGWDLEIMDGSTVVRTETALSTPSFTYTSAMQVTDFGSDQSTITYRWYQRSTVLGRGYVIETTS